MLIVNIKRNDKITLALAPDLWDSPHVAATPRDAAQGFPGYPLLGKIVPEIIKKVKKLISVENGGNGFKYQRHAAE